MPTLLVHRDVRGRLAKLDVSLRDSIRQKVLWAETQLAMTGRAPRAKGTRMQAWLRTPVRGNQYYLWWAPADEVGAGSAELGPAIAVRDLRHHDELVPPAPAAFSEYDVVHPRDLDPRSSLQASVARGASPSGITSTIVRGQPGTGKTLSLLYAARDLAASHRVLYITYTHQLVEEALLFANAVGIGDKLLVMTLAEVEAAILGDSKGAPAESPSALARRFDGMVRSLDKSVVSVWSNKGNALWAEARACLVGMALPFAWRRGPQQVPPCEILDLGIYREMSGLDGDVAEKARHIADLARRRGLLSDQTRARAALDALISGQAGDLKLDGVHAVLLDEAQDLTPIEIALLLELPRVIARREKSALFIAAGDESQTVHPSGFEWGVAKDLIRERLGREPKDIGLGQAMRSPSAVVSIVNKAGTLYKSLPKNFRPSGAIAVDIPATEDAGRVLQCEIPENGGYEALLEALLMSPGRAVVRLEPPSSSGGDRPAAPKGQRLGDDAMRGKGSAVTFTPAEIKGLERRVVVVSGLDETLSTFNRLTTRGARENRSLESLEARYLVDGVRVALSRATETLIIPRSSDNREEIGRLPVDLSEGAELIQWDELLSFLREDNLSEPERAYGFLAEAQEHEGRGDAIRAIDRLDRAEAIERSLSDPTLSASIRELRKRLEMKAGLRVVVAEMGGDYTSLDEAIERAPKGASIYIRPGTYHGSFVVDKNLKIIGDGPKGSIVLEGDIRVLTIESCDVTLDGLSIHLKKGESVASPKPEPSLLKKAGKLVAKAFARILPNGATDAAMKVAQSDEAAMAVSIVKANVVIRRCEVSSEGGRGIFGAVSSTVHLDGCTVQHSATGIVAGTGCFMTIERSEVKDCEYGISAMGGARLIVRKSNVHSIKQDGISLFALVEARIEDNDIRSTMRFGMLVFSDVIAMVRGNRIHQCYGGIKLEAHGAGVFEDNDITESQHVGFWVSGGGDPTVRNNRIRKGSQYGIYVDLKGGGRFEENQVIGNDDSGMMISGEGMIVVRGSLFQANAVNYPSVHVGAGTTGIFEDNDISAMRGANYALCVDAGDGFVVRKNRVHHNPTQAIVCRAGDCLIEDNECYDNGDMGIGVEMGGSPIVRRNLLYRNRCGIALRDKATGIFEDNELHTHSDINIYISDSGGTFRRNRIRKAPRHGVLILEGAAPTFEDNDISDSGTMREGANVCVDSGATPILRNNKIHGALVGLIFNDKARGIVDGNDITKTSMAGVVVKNGSAPLLCENRIHDIKAFGIVVHSAGGTIENNEIFGNGKAGLRTESENIIVRGNHIHDNIGGGILIQPKTKGTFEKNQVIANKPWGIMVTNGADPTLRENRVQGSPIGIGICEAARGTYIKNDVRGNLPKGLLLDPEAAPILNVGNIADEDTTGGKPSTLKLTIHRPIGLGKKKKHRK